MNKRYIDFVPAPKDVSRIQPKRRIKIKTEDDKAKPVKKVEPKKEVKPAEETKPVKDVKPVEKIEPVKKAAPVRFSRSERIVEKLAEEPKKETLKKEVPKKELPKVVPEEKMPEEEVPVEKMFAERPKRAGVSSGLKNAKLGVIEDYRPRFVQTEVDKRPLGANKVSGAPIKKPVGKTSVNRPPVSKPPVSKPPVSKPPVRMSAKTSTKPLTTPRMAPRANFVNAGKVEKRPLSKSIYNNRPATAPKEESKSPVVIIEKPEKDSKAGMVVAIILTIILGAAAGTVAFLLLPK